MSLPDTLSHAVIYTDGGSDSPTVSGYGVHGYFYNELKTDVKVNPPPVETPCEKGYVTEIEDGHVKEGKPVVVVNTVDIMGAAPNPSTNNTAEMMGAMRAMVFLLEQTSCTHVQFIPDSSYVMDGLTKYLPRWKKNHWVKSDGEPVKNEALWKQLDELYTQLCERMEPQWGRIKGHLYYGNICADKNATIGKDMASNHITDEKVIITDGPMTKNKVIGKPASASPFFDKPAMWFITNTQPVGDLNFYHTGNFMKEFYGKEAPEHSLAVVALKEPDPLIDWVKAAKNAATNGTEEITTRIHLDRLLVKRTYREVMALGRHILGVKGPHRDISYAGNCLTKTEVPPLLAHRGNHRFNLLHRLLNDYINGTLSDDTRLTEVTNDYYDITTNSKGKVKYTVKDFKTITLNCHAGKGDSTIKVTLTIDLDTPSRNVLSRLSGADVHIHVLTWPASEGGYHYATLLTKDGEYALYMAYSSNVRYDLHAK